jgi:hypothetical protein
MEKLIRRTTPPTKGYDSTQNVGVSRAAVLLGVSEALGKNIRQSMILIIEKAKILLQIRTRLLLSIKLLIYRSVVILPVLTTGLLYYCSY